MIIGTISSQETIPRIFSTEYPYVFGIVLIYNTTGTYWETVFGAPHEQQLSTVQVQGVSVNFVVYSEAEDIDDCAATEGTWYFDAVNQKPFIHLNHDVDYYTATIGYGRAIGFSDDDVVSINDIEYLPLIESIPSLAQVQDPVGSDRMATLNGEMVLRNVGGEADYLLSQNIVGGDARLFFLHDSDISADGTAPASSLVPLASFFVQDLKPGIEKFSLPLQDKRLSQDAPFPTTRFAVADYPNLDDSSLDLPIPVVYGYQRELKAYPTNGKASSTTVRYRAGLLLTVLTTVYLKINDKWTVSTPSNISLSTGEFDVAGGKSTTTAEPYECKIEATGITVTYAPDVIKDLNSRFGGVGFESSFYDTAEWESEQTPLVTVGPVFKEVTSIFEAAGMIQNGANRRFRYEINADGKRTIRVDDDDRELRPVGIDNVDIVDSDRIEAEFDTEFLAAQIRIGYAKSDESDKYLTVLDDSQKAQVISDYRVRKELQFDTLLTTQTHALARAAWDAEKYSVPIKTVEVTLIGVEYLSLRIFDMFKIALTQDEIDLDTGETEGRTFLGVQECKVLGIDPDYRALTNRVKLQIIRPITPNFAALLVLADGTTNIMTASGTILRRGGQ